MHCCYTFATMLQHGHSIRLGFRNRSENSLSTSLQSLYMYRNKFLFTLWCFQMRHLGFLTPIYHLCVFGKKSTDLFCVVDVCNCLYSRSSITIFGQGDFLVLLYFNSLWPSDTIWGHRSWSTLAQAMACCLTAPSHYLNQYWHHQWGLVALISGQFHRRCSRYLSSITFWKLLIQDYSCT